MPKKPKSKSLPELAMEYELLVTTKYNTSAEFLAANHIAILILEEIRKRTKTNEEFHAVIVQASKTLQMVTSNVEPTRPAGLTVPR